MKETKLLLVSHILGILWQGIAAHANILSVVTVVVIEGQGWTVQQRCLGAVTLDLVQPDDPAVPSTKSAARSVQRHVAAGVKQNGKSLVMS